MKTFFFCLLISIMVLVSGCQNILLNSDKDEMSCLIDGDLWYPRYQASVLFNNLDPLRVSYNSQNGYCFVSASRSESDSPTEYLSFAALVDTANLLELHPIVYSEGSTSMLRGFMCEDYVLDTLPDAAFLITKIDFETNEIKARFKFTATAVEDCEDVVEITQGRISTLFDYR